MNRIEDTPARVADFNVYAALDALYITVMSLREIRNDSKTHKDHKAKLDKMVRDIKIKMKEIRRRHFNRSFKSDAELALDLMRRTDDKNE